MTETDLQYGEELRVDPGTVLYSRGESLPARPIYCIVAGLVRLEIDPGTGPRIPVYLLPDSVFGAGEALLDCPRLARAYVLENTVLYRWDLEGFDIASGISWELAMHTITGMTQVLRILNAEFSDRLSARDGKQ
jgi:CRP-like cAMP-binding protein